jgi:methylmalonyl-CoA/ethylmalonyl-CoA epimerase
VRLDHIGVAVRDIAQAEKLFVSALGGRVAHRETVAHMKLRVCKIELGGATVELLQPGEEGEETISKFLAKRGEGIHHICYEVDDLQAAQQALAAQGYRPIWEQPRMGSSRKLVTFLHPRDTHGVLIELSQRSP